MSFQSESSSIIQNQLNDTEENCEEGRSERKISPGEPSAKVEVGVLEAAAQATVEFTGSSSLHKFGSEKDANLGVHTSSSGTAELTNNRSFDVSESPKLTAERLSQPKQPCLDIAMYVPPP